MLTRDSQDYVAYTIFCDDIRQEIGGKVSYMGVYRGGKLFAHSPFPLTLPKFGLAVHYAQKKGHFVRPTSLRVYLPGDDEGKPSIEAEFPTVIDELNGDAPPIAGTDPTFIAAMIQLVLAPLVITQSGPIKVRAVRGDEMIRLGTLEVHQAPDVTPTPASET
jgi:hypothetical protein